VDLVRFERVPGALELPLPERATPGSAGFDVRSAEPAFDLAPGVPHLVRTGFRMELPPGMEAQVRPRSGLALRHAITIPNAPGTIDPDFRGEVKVILLNLGGEPFRIEPGDRIAQLVFARFAAPTLAWSEALTSTDRGTGGFGSTGAG
jgi:dUTP pyrophosphatase